MNNQPHITTFYSYKGGVGRTMLLANAGALLARMGRKVLLWDLDVEAPGMHFIPALRPDPVHETGFLEWLKDLQSKKKNVIPAQDDLEALSGSIKPVAGIETLSILPAFGAGADSAGLYQDIRWQEFLVEKPDDGLNLFRTILDHFAQKGKFEHILLDSRTGITDLGGLMTAILPHAVVLVGSYGSQNLSGLLQIDRALGRAAQGKYAVARAPLPDLKRLLVISPVPRDQEERLAARREVYDREFPGLGGGTEMETRVEIPFESRLLFREDLLAVEEAGSEIAKAYAKVAAKIDGFLEELAEDQREEESAAAMYPDIDKAAGKDFRHEKGKTFEDRVARLLALLGYQVEREQFVGGNRVDLIARQKTGLREECFLVECKDLRKPAGKDVLEKLTVWLYGDEARAMQAEGMVVANSFSPAALTFAKSSHLLVFTPEELERRLFDFGPYLARLREEFERGDLARTYVPQRVLLENNPDRVGADLLDHAVKWARGEGTRLWLLLGDYGTGKTAFFKRFAYELAVRAGEPGLPVPIAVDLKMFPNAISLEGLLQEHLRASVGWNGNPEILLHLLASGRVILLLDAFDEMGTAAIGRSVEDQFRQLLKPLAGSGEKTGNRILITCRTHFFRDQQNVKDILHGAADDLVSRDSDLGKLARAFDGTIDEVLLFNQDQIRLFLDRHLSAAQARQAEAFIKNTYDLSSLAPRPVLLEMIVNSLPKLIRSKSAVTPAGLYHLYTTQWLEDKSGGTLQTSPRLRKKILEHLAFDLWGRPQHRVHHRELIAVLGKMSPGMLEGIDPDRVDLELRTAAFLIRTREGFYSFSHKSFMEFFFSRHILASLDNDPACLREALATAPITPECAAFFCDLAAYGRNGRDGGNACGLDHVKQAVQDILAGPYKPRASENALLLAYFCAGYHFRHPDTDKTEHPTLAHCMKPYMPETARLHGAVLRGMNLSGAWLEKAELGAADLEGADLSLVRAAEADFAEARMTGAKLENADCRGADFTGAELREARAVQADFTGAVFERADLTATVFVKTRCVRASFQQALCHRTRFAQAKLDKANWQDAVMTAVTGPGARPLPPGMRGLPTVILPLPQTGHFNSVTSAVFSSDGKHVLTASDDKTAALWDRATGKQVLRYEGHSGGVTSAVFSPDGKHVLTASDDKTAALWDRATGKLIQRYEGHGSSVNSAVISPDGKHVLTASDDKTAALWDRATGKQVLRYEGHGSSVNSAVISPDGKHVLTASWDKTAALWDRAAGEQVLRYEGHAGGVTSAVFSPDGKHVLTASDDKMAALWNRATGKQVLRYEGHGEWVNSAVFSPDGKHVLTASDDDTAVLWDRATGKQVLCYEGHAGGVTSAVFSPDGKHVLTASWDDTVALWDRATGKQVLRYEGHGEWVNSAVFSPDGKHVLTASWDKTATLWDRAAGKQVLRYEGHAGRVTSAVFSPDGKHVLTASWDKTAALWDRAAGEQVLRYEGHGEWVTSAVFSPDGKHVLTASGDKTAALWDRATGKQVLRYEGHSGGVTSAVFSPDGKHVLTASDDKTAALWDRATGKQVLRYKGHGEWVNSAVFSSDGKHVLTASWDKTAALWDRATGKQVLRYKGHGEWVTSAIFSPDGKHVLTASWDKTAALWDRTSGKLIRRYEGHGERVNSAVLSPDGKHVLTASFDKTAALWDAGSAARLLVLAAFPDGWLSLDRENKYVAGGAGLSHLTYYDPDEKAFDPTLWEAEDLPHMAR